MKKVVLLLICLYEMSCAVAQSSVGGVNTRLLDSHKPHGLFTEIKAPEREIQGDTYLNMVWLSGTIELITGEAIKDKPVRYDIRLDQLEIRIEGKVKGIQGRNINWFSVVNETNGLKEVFINGRDYTLEGARVEGFLRQINKGDWFLVSRTQVHLQEGAYVAAIDIGNKDSEYVKKSKYYIVRQSQLHEVVSNRKKFSEQFGSEKEDILQFIKENSLSLRNEEDILSLLNFLNKNI